MNNPLDTAKICTLFYPLLGQTRIEDNITCAHWDSLRSKQKPKTQEKKKKGGREHRVQTWYSCIIPVDEALRSITEITPPCDIMISSHKQILCDSTMWDSVAAWKYTCHWLAHQGTKTHRTFAPHLPNKNERSDELMWQRHAPKGKNRCRREEAKALGAWKQNLLPFVQHKLQLRTLWQAANEELPGSFFVYPFS